MRKVRSGSRIAAQSLALALVSALTVACGNSSDPGSSDLPELAYFEGAAGAPVLNRIVLVRADGEGRRVLWEDPAGNVLYQSPQFTPNGDALLYYREANLPPAPPESGWWIVPVDGGQPQPFIAPVGARPRFAPVGNLVAWAGSDWLGIAPRGSSTVVRIIPDTMRLAGFDWSPDGTRIVVSLYSDLQPDQNLFLVSPSGGDLVPLAPSDPSITSWEFKPMWSPDGSLIAYVKDAPSLETDGGGLWVTAPDGSGNRRLSTGLNSDLPVAWMTGGREILVVRQSQGLPNVRGLLDVETGEFRELDVPGSLVERPLSSDGQFLLLASRSPINEPAVVVTDADGGGRKQMHSDAFMGMLPVWRP